jgi:phosphoribosyl 1,2-cyclic phosphodiesterase
MNDYSFLVKLYGVRGSYPIASGTKYGGNTTCMLTRTLSHVVIFDAGSGLIQLGKELIPEILEHKKTNSEPFQITIIFTHTHIDHLMGLNFFIPVYMPGVHVNFIGPATLGVDLEDILRTTSEPQFHPVSMDEFRSTKYFENINENMVIYFLKDDPNPLIDETGAPPPENVELTVKNMKYYFHPKDGSYNYRIECAGKLIVFATDVEQYSESDQRLINFANGADVLIHDSQYDLDQYKLFQGYGHSNYKMACDVATKANVKKLLLFHHDPTNDDQALEKIESEAKKLFANAELAKEGWELKI